MPPALTPSTARTGRCGSFAARTRAHPVRGKGRAHLRFTHDRPTRRLPPDAADRGPTWEVVALLLERGGDVQRGTWFGPDSTPLAWAAHGSTQCPDRDGDWLAVAELLVAAGSTVGAGMLDDADEELAEWLRDRLAQPA